MRTARIIAAAGLFAIGINAADAQTTWEKFANRLGAKSQEWTKAGDDPKAVPDEAPADMANVPEGAVVEEQEGSLLSTIGLPMLGEGKKKNQTQINLGLESEEPKTLESIFSDPEVKSMLGESPRFVYNANDRPDPMIFPPVRNAAIYMELSKEAEQLIADGKYRDALGVYQKILDLKDRRFILDTKNKIATLSAEIGAIAAANTAMSLEPIYELPEWVRENTNGILLDPKKPMCLVGDYLLKQGDPVPNYPEVKVASIEKERVTYRVANQSFEVPVKGYEE